MKAIPCNHWLHCIRYYKKLKDDLSIRKDACTCKCYAMKTNKYPYFSFTEKQGVRDRLGGKIWREQEGLGMGGGEGRERMRPSADSLPKCREQPGLSQAEARSLELNPGPLGIQVLEPPLLPPLQHIRKELAWRAGQDSNPGTPIVSGGISSGV